jgi:hypothetical protein
MSGHMTADLGEIGLAGPRLVDQRAVEHHHQAVGEFQQLVEVFADQQHCGAAIARRHDLGVNLRDRGEIQAEARIGGDQNIDFAARCRRTIRRSRYRPISS